MSHQAAAVSHHHHHHHHHHQYKEERILTQENSTLCQALSHQILNWRLSR